MIVYGFNVVKTLIEKKYEIKKLFIRNKKSEMYYIAKKHNVHINKESDFKDKKLLFQQNYVAIIDDYKYLSVKELFEKAFKKNDKPIIFLLDKITDPQNLGAIIRNLTAFEIEGLIIQSHHQALVNDVVIKTSSGTALFLDIAISNSFNVLFEELKKQGFWIVSTTLEGNSSIDDIINIDMPLAIVLGSENNGISKSLIPKSDYQLKINISKEVESLNVSSTSAILCYELKKNKFKIKVEEKKWKK